MTKVKEIFGVKNMGVCEGRGYESPLNSSESLTHPETPLGGLQ